MNELTDYPYITVSENNDLLGFYCSGDWFVKNNVLYIGTIERSEYVPVYEARIKRRLWVLWEIEKEVVVGYKRITRSVKYYPENVIVDVETCEGCK